MITAGNSLHGILCYAALENRLGAVKHFADETGRLTLFGLALLKDGLGLFSRRGGLRKHDIPVFIQQMESIGVNSLPVVLITALFTGMVLALQASDSLEQVLKGISLFIGRTVALPFIRELGPSGPAQALG